MKFLEKDLEQILWDNLHSIEGINLLEEKGLDCLSGESTLYSLKSRQLRIGNYGIADIVTLQRCEGKIYVTVFELKKDEIESNALVQASRYAKGIKRYLNKNYKGWYVEVDLVLIGRKLKTSDWVYLFDGFITGVNVYTYDYSINGIEFTRNSWGYELIEEGF